MKYFDASPEHALFPEERRPYQLDGRIDVKDLSYKIEDGTQLLSEINFNLKHGEHMALVGFSGSGKSTLAHCLAQLYKYRSGSICLDGKEISQLSKSDIVRNIGFVSQTPFIFLEDIIEMGMQYPVGTQGDNLSGGQRQKLAIARILLKKPSVMIMDEATSGLDNDSQARIQDLLESRWKANSTLIAVMHRLDIIRQYDLVAVMKDGKIVEMGAYEDLMRRQGILYDLVTGQK
jgi:ABC-type bacteriocin/lantibiotic exporter with double-glycine peptidase domain